MGGMKSGINGCYCFISMIIQTFGGKSIKLRVALEVKPITTTYFSIPNKPISCLPENSSMQST